MNLEEFMKMDLRVAEIKSATPVEGASKLLHLKVSLGAEERDLVAGVASRYTPKELVGKKIVIVANLEPKKIKGLISQGMLLAADAPDGPHILFVDEDVPAGTRVR
ncbi:MAG: methionine--tRNA ligase subunit beta [Candidatus Korarchaeota archaeon]